MKKLAGFKVVALVAAAWSVAAGASVLSVRVHATSQSADVAKTAATPTVPVSQLASSALDRTGRTRVGIASFYAAHYEGKKMADGTPFKVNGNNAASVTLPLGTTARVTNLQTGKSAVVVIRDRGPYVSGRIVDLSPGTASMLGISRKQGLAKVSVAPLAVPLADGSVNITAARFASN